MAHDFKKYPELTNQEIEEHMYSPHPQITEDIWVDVVKVIDGDTIRVVWEKRDFDFPVRFLGIDAPEMNEGGFEAREYLKGVIEGEEVLLKIDQDQRVGKYGRLLAKVISLGMDVGEMMMRLGYAKDFDARDEGKLKNLNKELRMEQWL